MSCCNCGYEGDSAIESKIIREVFPELLEASELDELSEQEALAMEGGRRRMASFGGARYAAVSRPSIFRRIRRRPVRHTRYSYNLNVPQADPRDIAWAQSCLAQIIGAWVRKTGRLDAVTRRAIRNFQSRQRLAATGLLDQQTLAALRQACGQQSEPAQVVSSAPPPDSSTQPDTSQADSAQGQDDPGAQDASSSQDEPAAADDSPAPDDAPPQQEWYYEGSAPAVAGCKEGEDRCTKEYVSWMQTSLNRLGAKLSITGTLDRNTINAINQFKRLHGISSREYYASPLLENAFVQAGADSPPPKRKLPCAPTDMKVLLPLLKRYRGDIPLEYLLGWITVESGGKLGDLTKICERGYFQIHPEESQQLKLDHDRLSTDAAYSVEGGVKLVSMYKSGIDRLADQLKIDKKGDLFWGLVKLRHWIPSAPQRLLLKMSQDRVPVVSWVSIRQFVGANPALRLGGFDPRDGIKSVDKYLTAAARWRKRLAGGA